MNPFSFHNFFRRRQRQQEEDDDMEQSFVNQVVMAEAQHDDESTRPSGSRRGKKPNKPRQRLSRGHNLMEDYFIERPIFDAQDFRRRYRMSRDRFNIIMTDLCNHDMSWHQREDATGLLGLLPQQKMTGALRMLAYGSAADQCTEITRMGESTTLKCMKEFCSQVVHLYGPRYLRSPTPADLTRLLAKAERRGFPGMIGSIDCMHWEWKNCPTAYQGAYSGRKGRPTVILEAVASYDTWIWHRFFGCPGAKNDINVLHLSNVFSEILAGRGPTVVFEVHGQRYTTAYYLADGIYPRYSTFVKTISNPQTPQDKLFAKKQEAYRKDVERAFGILQSRWAIIRHSCTLHHKSVMTTIMLACIILHNMIVEEEYVDDEDDDEEEEEDLQNPSRAFRVYDGPVNAQGNRVLFEPISRDGANIQRFHDRVADLESAYIHRELQKDLVKHIWRVETGEIL